MISRLRGEVIKKGPRFAIVEVGSGVGSDGNSSSAVGYKVFLMESVLDSLSVGQKTSLWTHFVVREDAQDLYGFVDEESLALFELLISISGIGPKTGLNVLNIVSPKTLRRAVSSGDTSYLTKVSGIGRKIAQKIVIELKDKFEAGDSALGGEMLGGDSDALEALKSLGYQEREARDVLRKIGDKNGDAGGEESASEKVKKALKILGQK